MAGSNLGFSATRLARIEAFLKTHYVETGKLAGALVTISRRNETVHTTVVGLADLERNVTLRDDAIFRIYSMTKPITSVGVFSASCESGGTVSALA